MPKHITKETVLQADELAREMLYVDHGQEMITLACTLLGGKDEDVDLGLNIIAQSWQEVDEDNIDSKPGMWNVSYDCAIAPLEKLLHDKERGIKALYALLIACRQNKKVSVSSANVLEALKEKLKGKEHDMNQKEIGVRLLVHAFARENALEEILKEIKSSETQQDAAIDELSYFASTDYPVAPLLTFAQEGLMAKGESRVMNAVSLIEKLQKSGTNVAVVIPYLIENQVKLTGFTMVLDVLGYYYFSNKKYDELFAALNDPDEKKAESAYRSVYFGGKETGLLNEFLSRPGVSERMDAMLKQNGSLPRKSDFGIK